MSFIADHLAHMSSGSAVQQQAYRVWQQLEIDVRLSAYCPCLVGTFPLDLQVPGSDLDVVCEVYELGPFEEVLVQHYGHYPGFAQWRTVRQGLLCTVTAFQMYGLPVEIFGQPLPSRQQFAYRHMQQEYRLLELGGCALRTRLEKLRAEGMKTEPAFAHALQLPGVDPYAALLTLEKLTDEQLRKLLERQKLLTEPA